MDMEHHQGLNAIFEDSGQDQSGMTYNQIWEYLKGDTEDSEEKKRINDLKAFSLENKEKPIYGGKIKIQENGETVRIDLLWKKSKVALFLKESLDEYKSARKTDWKVFCFVEDFKLEDFVSKIREA